MPAVIVTGATSGIGRAIAQSMLQLGWDVIGVGLPVADPPQLAELLLLDLTADDAPAQVVDAVRQRPLHGLVNAAGINLPVPLEGLSVSDFERQLAVNVAAPLRLIQACLPLLRPTQGRIVNLSSVMGEAAMPTLGAYSMSKHALEAMSDTLRLELRPWQIAVCVVQMGAIATPMTVGMTESLAAAAAHLTPELQALYRPLLMGMQQSLVRQERAAQPTDRVTAAVQHALTHRHPKPRYRVDGVAKGLSLMRRLAPEAIGDWILLRALGIR